MPKDTAEAAVALTCLKCESCEPIYVVKCPNCSAKCWIDMSLAAKLFCANCKFRREWNKLGVQTVKVLCH